MKEKLICSNNSLLDIINWLKLGNIICLYNEKKNLVFNSKETLTNINKEKLIYIDLKENPNLLNDDEWPWYIKNEGFVEYKSINILPQNKNNIYNLKL